MTKIAQYYEENNPNPSESPRPRLVERGSEYLTDEVIHYDLVVERVLNNTEYGVLVMGPSDSGKSTLGELLRALHHCNTSRAYLTIKLGWMKTGQRKNSVMSKLSGMHTQNKQETLTAKLNYCNNIIFVDDLGMDDGVHHLLESIIATRTLTLPDQTTGTRRW